jgi:ribosomal protein L11 methyltransferase
MKWLRVKIDYYSDFLKETKEKITGIFSELGVNEFEFIDFFTENALDFHKENLVNDTWAVIGYFPNNKFAGLKLKMLSEKMEELSESEEMIFTIYTNECDENEWKDEWKKYFHTTKITDKIVIKPSWEEYTPLKGEVVIKIDPGMAFGTGTHETTSLCIKMLEEYAKDKENLLDIGCGSGILMIVGAKLGIKSADGIDIDPAVEEVVRKNLDENEISNYSVMIGNLVDSINKKYDIVVSNILADTLMELLNDIEKVLNPKALVIFSGILKSRKNEILEKTEKHNFRKIDEKEENEWISYVFEYK